MNSQTILVVEDDPSDETLTLRALRTAEVPCSVVVARTGQNALDFLRRQGQFSGRKSPDPAVVFLDNTLPGKPGNELVTEIRAEPALQSVPLVIFSGSSDENLVDKCLRAGANSYLEKPVDMDQYMDQLRKAVQYWLRLNLGPGRTPAYSPSFDEYGLE